MASRSRLRRILLPAGLPALHALMTPAVAHAFDTLRVGASLSEETQWHAVHVPGLPVTSFELAHGKEAEREAYNQRFLGAARSTGRTILGEHAGFSDYYVPIVAQGIVRAVLVTGPFSTKRPTSADVLERWHWISGQRGYPSDPEFAQYVATTLDTLLLEGEDIGRFARMLECFALLCAGECDARVVAGEAAELRAKLELNRDVDRMWDAARTMIDERTTRSWLSPHNAFELSYLGLSALPEHVLVGLALGRMDAPDPVGDMLARDAFQRGCVEIARSIGNVVCGRVAEHGVVFLIGGGLSAGKARRLLSEVGERAMTLARKRFGLTLHVGTSSAAGPALLSARFAEALRAAETAALEGRPSVRAEPGPPRPAHPVRELRQQMASVAEQHPHALAAKFEQYIAVVAVYAGYRLELVRAHLDAGFERAAQALLGAGALSQQGALDMYEALDRAALDASTVGELAAAYRLAVNDLVESAQRPVVAAQDRSLRRAVSFINERFAEAVTLPKVAQIAGLSPRYFSELFKRRQGTTFEQYLRDLRIHHAKQLLTGTDLGVERVGQLSGYPIRSYFHRVFRELVGMTPVEFRSARS